MRTATGKAQYLFTLGPDVQSGQTMGQFNTEGTPYSVRLYIMEPEALTDTMIFPAKSISFHGIDQVRELHEELGKAIEVHERLRRTNEEAAHGRTDDAAQFLLEDSQ